MNHNNIGRFMLDLKFVKEQPDAVANIFREMNFVPVRAEIIDWGHYVDYIGLSPKFREITQGEDVPLYDIEIAQHVQSPAKVRNITEAKGQGTPVAGGA